MLYIISYDLFILQGISFLILIEITKIAFLNRIYSFINLSQTCIGMHNLTVFPNAHPHLGRISLSVVERESFGLDVSLSIFKAPHECQQSFGWLQVMENLPQTRKYILGGECIGARNRVQGGRVAAFQLQPRRAAWAALAAGAPFRVIRNSVLGPWNQWPPCLRAQLKSWGLGLSPPLSPVFLGVCLLSDRPSLKRSPFGWLQGSILSVL